MKLIFLDDLRILVEKSELWVYKAVKVDDKKVFINISFSIGGFSTILPYS